MGPRQQLLNETPSPQSSPERSRRLREFGEKFWDGTKRLGKKAAKFAVAVGLGLSIICGGCRGNEESSKSRFEETGILTTPFDGKLVKDKDGNYYMANRLLVGFSKDVSDKDVLALFKQYNAKITGKIPQLRIYEIEVDEGRLDDSVSAAKDFSSVSFVERNYFAEMTASLDNDSYQGADKDALWWSKVIQLSEAYKYLEENGVQLRPTTVAVIDASFDLEISELKNQYVDKRYHYDFGDNDNDVSNADMWSYYGTTWCVALSPILHGSQVAALVAAENNGVVINGVVFNAKILPLKNFSSYILKQLLGGTLSQILYGDNFKISAGLAYVGDLQDELSIRAVNMSFGFKKGIFEGIPDALHLYTLKSAVESLYSKGIVLVAAAGNDNADSSNYYPCAYPEVICVGGTELKDGVEQRYAGSNFSDDINALAIAAPAANILTTIRVPEAILHPPCQDILVQLIKGSNYVEGVLSGSGTSFASPIVAGTAALLKSIDPTLTPAETLQILRDTADDVETDKGTWKRVNVYKAVKKLACEGQSICEGDITNGCSKIIQLDTNLVEDLTVRGFYDRYVLMGPYDYIDEDYYVIDTVNKTMEKIEFPEEFPQYAVKKGIWKNYLIMEAKTPSTEGGPYNSIILYNFKTKTFTIIDEGISSAMGKGVIMYTSYKPNKWGITIYDIDTGESKLIKEPGGGIFEQTASPSGVAITAYGYPWGDTARVLLVNSLNNPNGEWRQVTNSGMVDFITMYSDNVAFWHENKLKTYNIATDTVRDTGVSSSLPITIDMWSNRLVYPNESGGISAFDLTSGTVYSISMPPFTLSSPHINQDNIVAEAYRYEWKQPPGYYDLKELWVVLCGIPKNQTR